MSSILMGHAREGLEALDAVYSVFERLGLRYSILDGPRGVALAMMGQVSEGIHLIKQQVLRFDELGHFGAGAWERIILAEIYIEVLSRKQKPPISVLIRNFRTIAGIMLFGARRARTLLEQAAAVKQLSEHGFHMARINFDLGVLSAMKKKREEARGYFEKARVVAKVQGADKLIRKIDGALAEVQ